MRSPHAAQRMTSLISLIIIVCTGMIGQAGTAEAQASYTVLHAFTLPPSNPTGALVRGSDGALYGTTQGGGAFNRGTVFKVAPDGSGFTVLHSFSGSDGAGPSGLVQGSDGAFYGTTQTGGGSEKGTVFKLTADGTSFTTLHSFTGIGTEGAYPRAGLVQASDGDFYGTTYYGGSSNVGTVFKLAADGTGFTTLHSFSSTDGSGPFARLVQGTDGALYGTTYSGGPSGAGTVFKLSTDGTGFATLHPFGFGGPDGATPQASLIQGTDGSLYGTTWGGGPSRHGTVFKLAPDGTGITTLHAFGGPDGATPQASLIQGTDGSLYGTTWGGGPSDLGSVFKIGVDGAGFTTLHSFSSPEGTYPNAGLLQESDGMLYGTTWSGGSSDIGTIFKLAPGGTEFSTLHSFSSPDGVYPNTPLVQGSDGMLYGTTYYGGTSNYGTVFKLAADGTGFTTLHTFKGTDGRLPSGGLVQGADALIYGVTQRGGASDNGTVFKLAADGTGLTTFHSFSFTDGAYPNARLVQGTDGFLYGTTMRGGAFDRGTIFKLAPDGSGFATLPLSSNDGAYPLAGLIQGSDGKLYGTASAGGLGDQGTVFKVAPDGTGFNVLHSFSESDGSNPIAGLVQGTDGAVYGTTTAGGPSSFGTVFKLAADGVGFTILHAFNQAEYPVGSLVQGTDGALYGTTSAGSFFGYGTVFKLAPDGTGFTGLHVFLATDGASPRAGLLQGGARRFYGTTFAGGPGDGGVVFLLQLTDPTLALELSQSIFHIGQHLSLTATVTPGWPPTKADVYIALLLPDGSLRFLQGGGSLTTSVQPLAAQWPVGPFNGQLFSYTFGGGEPTGSYAWLAGFTQPGTLNFIGPIVSAPFSFSP